MGMIFKGERSGILHIYAMTVDPAYEDVKENAGGNTWYMTESKHVISSVSFKSFSGQSISFGLSIKEF